MQKYSKEIKEFIASNVVGMTSEEIAQLVNCKFGTDYTAKSIRSFKKNNKLKSGVKKGRKAGFSDIFTEEIQIFIRDHVAGRTAKELTNLINSTFNTDYIVGQLRSYKKNHNLPSGYDSKFKIGSVPPNKGTKGIRYPGSEKTWFKRGVLPHNHKPIGSERIDSKDGYTLIKTAEPNVWELKHKVIYEKIHGSLKPGYIVTFLDGDKTNMSIDNLEAITMADSLSLTRSKMRFTEAELTRIGLMIVKVKKATNNKRKQTTPKLTKSIKPQPTNYSKDYANRRTQ